MCQVGQIAVGYVCVSDVSVSPLSPQLLNYVLKELLQEKDVKSDIMLVHLNGKLLSVLCAKSILFSCSAKMFNIYAVYMCTLC